MDILKRIVDLRTERNWTEYQLAERSVLHSLQFLHGIVKICFLQSHR